MDLEINIVEASAELAERELYAMYNFTYPDMNREEIHSMMWVEVTSSDPKHGDITFVYTEEAQDLFGVMYDEIFSILIDSKSIEDDKS
jgi:hypothetical protein